MLQIILIIFSFVLISCDNYKKLSKHSSVNVAPETKVYFDIKDFEIGDLIQFEIKMDLFFGSTDRSSYNFSIQQVPATSYYDPYYWDLDHLVFYNNKNVSCSGSEVCTFSWDEIKKEGMNYIYIYPPAPFDDFYTFWDNKIKITHLGGLSGGAIAGIVIGCILFGGMIITLLVICCCCMNNKSCYDCCPCCACCLCCGVCNRSRYITGVGVSVVQPPIYPAVVPAPIYQTPVMPNVYVEPAYPAPGYPPGVANVPYSSAGIM